MRGSTIYRLTRILSRRLRSRRSGLWVADGVIIMFERGHLTSMVIPDRVPM